MQYLLLKYGYSFILFQVAISINFPYLTFLGAFYYYHPEDNKNYEQTLPDVMDYATKQKIPYRWVNADDMMIIIIFYTFYKKSNFLMNYLMIT